MTITDATQPLAISRTRDNKRPFSVRMDVLKAAAKQSYFHDKDEALMEKHTSDSRNMEMLEKICSAWKECHVKGIETTQKNISKTLDTFCDSLKEVKNALAQDNDHDNEEIILQIEKTLTIMDAKGLLETDLFSQKYDDKHKRNDFMAKLSDYFHKVIVYLKEDNTLRNRALEALKIFPSDDPNEYQCIIGTQSRLLFAQFKFNSAALTTLSNPHARAEALITQNVLEKIPEKTGFHIHVPVSTAYAMGTLSQEEANKSDEFYRLLLPAISPATTWKNYREIVLNSGEIINEDVQCHINMAIEQMKNKDGFLDAKQCTVGFETQFLKPYGISLKDLFNEDFELYDENKLRTLLKEAIFKDINNTSQELFSNSDHTEKPSIDWSEAVEVPDIPDGNDFFLRDAVKVVANDLTLDSDRGETYQKIALHSLLTFSKALNAPQGVFLTMLDHIGKNVQETVTKEQINAEKAITFLKDLKEKNPDFTESVDEIIYNYEQSLYNHPSSGNHKKYIQPHSDNAFQIAARVGVPQYVVEEMIDNMDSEQAHTTAKSRNILGVSGCEYLVYSRYAEALKKMFDKLPNDEARENMFGGYKSPLLHIAIQTGYTHMVKMLTDIFAQSEKKQNILGQRDTKHMSALDYIAIDTRQYPRMVEIILEAFGDDEEKKYALLEKDKDGLCALDKAAKAGHKKFIEAAINSLEDDVVKAEFSKYLEMK